MDLNTYENVILFDGVCNLCNASVQFVLKHDKNKIFKFAAQQSEIGQKLLIHHNLENNNLNSFVFIEIGKAFTRSTAALRVSKGLNFPINVLYGFIIVPAIVRDYVYDFIAEKRYLLFGKKESCMLPSDEYKARFL